MNTLRSVNLSPSPEALIAVVVQAVRRCQSSFAIQISEATQMYFTLVFKAVIARWGSATFGKPLYELLDLPTPP
jgi:hypothetical protein